MSLRYQRIAGLFEEGYSLTSISAWLRRVASENGSVHRHYDFLVSALNTLLDETGVRWNQGITDGEADFRLPDGLLVPFPALSDGYRAFLAWVGDLLRHLGDATPAGQDPAQLPGVVLVDEVDLHLHPEWQRRLLETLARTFPRLQFIVTSHSPVLAGTLPPENVLVVERQPAGPAIIRPPETDLYGKDVNRILHSPEFGLESTLAPSLEEKERKLRDTRASLAREYLKTGDKEAAKAYFEALTDDPHSG